MANNPGIHLKDISDDVYNVILDRQTTEKKNKKPKNLCQIVNILLEEAYGKKQKK